MSKTGRAKEGGGRMRFLLTPPLSERVTMLSGKTGEGGAHGSLQYTQSPIKKKDMV